MCDAPKEIVLDVLASFVNFKHMSALEDDGNVWRHELLFFHGHAVDASWEGSDFHGAQCSIKIEPSKRRPFDGAISIEAGMRGVAGADPEDLDSGGYPPINGEIYVPSDVYQQIRTLTSCSSLPEGWYHHFSFYLPLSSYILRRVPLEVRKDLGPVPLSAINLSTRIVFEGCTRVEYTRRQGAYFGI